MKLQSLRRDGDKRGWPGYLLWGRMRTSTFCLIVAFFLAAWLYETYQPPPPPEQAPAQLVPPGFVPDPEYTWVPRTSVREYPTSEPTWTPETTTQTSTPVTTTTPTTTETSTPETTTTPTTTPPAPFNPFNPFQPSPTPEPPSSPPGFVPTMPPVVP